MFRDKVKNKPRLSSEVNDGFHGRIECSLHDGRSVPRIDCTSAARARWCIV